MTAVDMQHLWVPPHTRRVTGAVRQALAGIPEIKIQVFARWGSNVVLRYIRDAGLGVEGSLLTPDLSLQSVRPELLSRTPVATDAPAAAVRVNGLVEQVVEERIAKRLSLVKEELMAALSEKLQEMLSQVSPDEDMLPQAVKCLNDRFHIPVTEELCFCGWPWAARGGSPHDGPIPEAGSEEAVREWCSLCIGIF